jgi:hypothetical protein
MDGEALHARCSACRAARHEERNLLWPVRFRSRERGDPGGAIEICALLGRKSRQKAEARKGKI